MELSERDRAILDFERQSVRLQGPKEGAIRSELGLSRARYYELLRRLLDDPRAYEYDPFTVKRVRNDRRRRLRRRFIGREVDPRQR